MKSNCAQSTMIFKNKKKEENDLEKKLSELKNETESQEESTSEEEEDEDAVLSRNVAAEFLEVIPLIASGDKSLKDPNTKVFTEYG